jgi:hypothetical protein
VGLGNFAEAAGAVDFYRRERGEPRMRERVNESDAASASLLCTCFPAPHFFSLRNILRGHWTLVREIFQSSTAKKRFRIFNTVNMSITKS